jgi:hypothetical protein
MILRDDGTVKLQLNKMFGIINKILGHMAKRNKFNGASEGGRGGGDDWKISDADSSSLPQNNDLLTLAGSEKDFAKMRTQMEGAGFQPADADDEAGVTAPKKPAQHGGSGFIVADDSPQAQRQSGFQSGGAGGGPLSGFQPGNAGGTPASGFQPHSAGPASPSRGFESASDPAVVAGKTFAWSMPFDWLESPNRYRNAINRRLDWAIARKLADPKADNVMLLIHGWRDCIPFIKTESRNSGYLTHYLNQRKAEILGDPELLKAIARQARGMGLGLHLDIGNNDQMSQFSQRLHNLTITNHPEAARQLRKTAAARAAHPAASPGTTPP